MGLGENFENLSKDAQEYVRRSIEGYRLQLVEGLSLLLGDMMCSFVVLMLLLIALLFFFATVVLLIAPFMGLPASLFVVMLFLVLLALLVYAMRVPLFVNGLVKRLIAIFYSNKDDDERI